ncbi:MAG TPA: hypothetical protein VLB46_20955 [Pyrinomonadaceae bacterium]|nr:hypothetical protein [Pyrinomonadaceae bacterium]
MSDIENGDVNAHVDPFQQTYAPEQAVADFCLLKASWILRSRGPLSKYEDVRQQHPDAYFSGGSVPKSVIFISHRWDSLACPDSSGKQADAIRYFLKAILDISKGLTKQSTASDITKAELLRHGHFQAAYFYESGMSFVTSDSARGWTTLHSESATPDRILESIGIFYDYSSVPQDKNSTRLVEVLRHLHNLILASTKLILRHPDDSYEERAWCAFEVAVSPNLDRMQCLPIVLRMDKLGDHITQEEISEPETMGFAATLMDPTNDFKATVIAIAVYYIMTLDSLEDSRECCLFTTRRAPNLFKGHEKLLWAAYSLLKRSSDEFQSGRRLRLSVEELVIWAMDSAALKTSYRPDLLYVGHMILYHRFRGDAQLARLIAASLVRVLEGRTTVLNYFSFEESTPIAGMAPSKVSFTFDD